MNEKVEKKEGGKDREVEERAKRMEKIMEREKRRRNIIIKEVRRRKRKSRYQERIEKRIGVEIDIEEVRKKRTGREDGGGKIKIRTK